MSGNGAGREMDLPAAASRLVIVTGSNSKLIQTLPQPLPAREGSALARRGATTDVLCGPPKRGVSGSSALLSLTKYREIALRAAPCDE